jgi:hypothetical protein
MKPEKHAALANRPRAGLICFQGALEGGPGVAPKQETESWGSWRRGQGIPAGSFAQEQGQQPRDG